MSETAYTLCNLCLGRLEADKDADLTDVRITCPHCNRRISLEECTWVDAATWAKVATPEQQAEFVLSLAKVREAYQGAIIPAYTEGVTDFLWKLTEDCQRTGLWGLVKKGDVDKMVEKIEAKSEQGGKHADLLADLATALAELGNVAGVGE